MSQLFVDSIEPKTSGEVVSINRGKGQVLEVLSNLLLIGQRHHLNIGNKFCLMDF